jgi:hypothetical protein
MNRDKLIKELVSGLSEYVLQFEIHEDVNGECIDGNHYKSKHYVAGVIADNILSSTESRGECWVSVEGLNQKLQGELKKGNSMASTEYVIEILNNALPTPPSSTQDMGE